MSDDCDLTSYWRDRIAIVKALILKYDAALDALSTGGMFQYSLDTGQTRQTVTRHNISSLKATRDSLLNELSTLNARVCGAGTHVVPSF